MDNFRRIGGIKKQMVVSSINVELNPSRGATNSITVKYDNNTLVSDLTISNALIDCSFEKTNGSTDTTITFTSTDVNTSMEDNKQLGYIILSDGDTLITVNVYLRTDYKTENRAYRVLKYYPERTYFRFPEREYGILFTGTVDGYGDRRNRSIDVETAEPVIPVDIENFTYTASGQEVDKYLQYSTVLCLTSTYPNYCLLKYAIEYNTYNKNYTYDVYTIYKDPTDVNRQRKIVVPFLLEYSTTDKHDYHIKVTPPVGDPTERDASIAWE